MSWTDQPPIQVAWRGRLSYAAALAEQRARREALLAGDDVPEVLWLLEHDPVVTTGLRDVDDLPPEPFWRERGVEVHRTERGGLATYHGPGQLVGYLVVRLTPRGLGVRRTIEALEDGLIGWLAGQGIEAGRRSGLPGVWVGRDKVAAVGLHVRRGVSLHGFALNLTVDLAPFGWFTPCGVRDGGVTSVAALAGDAPTPREAAKDVADQVLWSLLDKSVDRSAPDR